MILNIATTTEATRDEGIRMADDEFGVTNPEYIQATRETVEMLSRLDPNSILYDVSDEVLRGWLLTVPTQKELAEKFLSGEITEQELVIQSKSEESYDALYFCGAVTKEAYRRQNIASRLLEESVERIPTTPDCEYYAWPVSPEGESFIKKFQEKTGRVIHTRHE